MSKTNFEYTKYKILPRVVRLKEFQSNSQNLNCFNSFCGNMLYKKKAARLLPFFLFVFCASYLKARRSIQVTSANLFISL